MKTFSLLIIISFSLVTFQSCKKTINRSGDPLIGTWVSYNNLDYNTFEKANELDLDYRGMTFHENGDFIMRENSGFCGTPPIHYTNEEGTWEKIDETHFTLKFNNWMGPVVMKVIIIKVDDHELQWEIER